MRCEEIMKSDIECVSPTDTIQAAACKMRDHNVGFLPVCDEACRVVGTITDRDITVRLTAEGRSPSEPVSACMTAEVVACRPGDDLRSAEDLMGRYHKSRIMCLDAAGRLVGVISLSDIAQADSARKVANTIRQVTQREVHV